MKARSRTANISIIVSSILMMLTLLWLTVSTPFVFSARQQCIPAENLHSPLCLADSEDENPFANTTEEKTSGNSYSFSEEYLHEPHSSVNHPVVVSTEYNPQQDSIYIAFYGELISPPPDQLV